MTAPVEDLVLRTQASLRIREEMEQNGLPRSQHPPKMTAEQYRRWLREKQILADFFLFGKYTQSIKQIT